MRSHSHGHGPREVDETEPGVRVLQSIHGDAGEGPDREAA
jgi:hypothetical protein